MSKKTATKPQGSAVGRPLDADIEKILHDAFMNTIRDTPEYQFGRLEERVEQERELFKKCFEKTKNYADAFLNFIKKEHPKIIIKQFRIGIDYSSQFPAAMMIVDKKNRKDVETVRNIARIFEQVAWSSSISECYFWTKIDEDLDQELIENDFPYFRTTL